jgi:hypothetical protein
MLYLFIVVGSHQPLDLMAAGMNQMSSYLKIEIITVATILLSFDLMLLVAIPNLNIF